MGTHSSFRLFLLGLLASLLAACASGGDAAGSAGTFGSATDGNVSDTDPDGGDGGSDVCLLHNCASDSECGGCTEGRNTCYGPEKRCVACDPDTGEGCPDGKKCSEFGYCIDGSLECATDAEGNPTISCGDDPDCAACDPLHQICAAGACVACRGDATEACQSTEQCVDNQCVAQCPASCTTDAECSTCGTAGNEARICHNHACAECSEDSDCPGGETCSAQGACIPTCGIPGQVAGVCETDNECAGCRGDIDQCNAPINGGHGVCGPSASGCSDLGNGVVVLPEPFDQVTNACSDDADCSGVGIQYNVGKLLRDLTGISSIDDANINYPMSSCAAVTVGVGDTSLSCGICVPCKTDNDCEDIDVDDVASEAFGPLGGIATALLLDQLFGPNEHKIHMFCQPVAAGYGACVPCPTLINDCAGGSGGGSGNCDHDVCTVGGPLDPSCGGCAATVCSLDNFCCENTWDQICVDHVADECAGGCDGGGSGCHDQCVEGAALNPSCNACVSQICSQDPFCCQSSWDGVCVGLVDTVCGGECAGSGCAHSECQQGGPLQAGCSACATTVCNADNFCCATDWDALCVTRAEDLCSGVCSGGGCAHSECQQGGPLDAGCSSCAGAVCGVDDFCCTNTWDNFCVDAAQNQAACSC